MCFWAVHLGGTILGASWTNNGAWQCRVGVGPTYQSRKSQSKMSICRKFYYDPGISDHFRFRELCCKQMLKYWIRAYLPDSDLTLWKSFARKNRYLQNLQKLWSAYVDLIPDHKRSKIRFSKNSKSQSNAKFKSKSLPRPDQCFRSTKPSNPEETNSTLFLGPTNRSSSQWLAPLFRK